MKKVLIVLSDKDFDVTETSVPWKLLTNAGVKVDFTTENGTEAECDPLLLSGVIFGKLGAAEEAKKFYHELTATPEYKNPHSFSNANFMSYDAVILPGGHAKGMVPYLENTKLREKILPFINDPIKIVGAICHGTIVLCRTIDPETGKSVLYKRKSTCLPKYMERSAYYLTFWKLGRYYRTYDEYVEDEIQSVMENPGKQFQVGTKNLFGSLDEKFAYVCVDGNYVSARWPGDAYLFARTLLEKLNATTLQPTNTKS